MDIPDDLFEGKRILYLSLKKKWFDMIYSGDKKEEYREFKEYWIKRFGYYSSPKDYETGYYDEEMNSLPDIFCFTNGYGKQRPHFYIEVLEWSVDKSNHPEWGGNTKDIQFVFKLGSILKNKPTKQ